MNDADLAAAMYPSAAAPPAANYLTQIDSADSADSGEPAPVANATEQEIADQLYGDKSIPAIEIEVPENIQEMRKADDLRKMYSPQRQYANVIRDDHFSDDPDIPPEVAVAVVREMREMAADMGMTHDDCRTLTQVARSIKESPTPEQQREWENQAIDQLNREYGKGARQAMRDAQQFIAQDPRRFEIVENKRLGSHPEIITMFVRLAREARMAGRLK